MAFYVTVKDGERFALLAGPFNRQGDALRMKASASNAASKIDPRAAWYAYGTSRVKSGPMKPGLLNEKLGLPTDGSRITLADPPRKIANPRIVLHGTGPAPCGWVKCSPRKNRPGCYAEESHFHPLEAVA